MEVAIEGEREKLGGGREKEGKSEGKEGKGKERRKGDLGERDGSSDK